MQSAKEAAANVMASARSGLEKTKATVEEKTEKMGTSDPLRKEMATQKKEERIQEAERQKVAAMQQNNAARHEEAVGGFGHGYTTGGDFTAGELPPAAGYGGGECQGRPDYLNGVTGDPNKVVGGTGHQTTHPPNM